jgi:hypothetical protein
VYTRMRARRRLGTSGSSCAIIPSMRPERYQRLRKPGEDAVCEKLLAEPLFHEGKHQVEQERNPFGRLDIAHGVNR